MLRVFPRFRGYASFVRRQEIEIHVEGRERAQA